MAETIDDFIASCFFLLASSFLLLPSAIYVPDWDSEIR
jgi:hypothetical protein